MYKLVSKYGNDVVITDSERKRDRLIDLGYKEVKENGLPRTESARNDNPKTEGNKNGKNKAKSQRDS